MCLFFSAYLLFSFVSKSKKNRFSSTGKFPDTTFLKIFSSYTTVSRITWLEKERGVAGWRVQFLSARFYFCMCSYVRAYGVFVRLALYMRASLPPAIRQHVPCSMALLRLGFVNMFSVQ